MTHAGTRLKLAVYLAGLCGLAVLTALVIGSDVPALIQTALRGGWQLFWLVPYRTVFFLLYALGWWVLLRPYDATRRAGVGYLLWVTTVREAIDRLLPVASVGGAVAGVRLLGWRGIPAGPASATVIVEILLTLIASWLFAVLGVALLTNVNAASSDYHRVIFVLLLSLPVPVALAAMLRSGKLFGGIRRWITRITGIEAVPAGAIALDNALGASLRRSGALLSAAGLQFAALCSGSFENWFALRLFAHPISLGDALMLESMVQAFRHLAFVVPASLGVQETVLVIFGHSLGIGAEMAIAVSLVKRLRETLYGIASLASWQWMEGRRLRAPAEYPS
ncbi:MAG: lysylphosphatidylglycerol synthase domain-containing protein [Steroidobacteraceae bacterium]